VTSELWSLRSATSAGAALLAACLASFANPPPQQVDRATKETVAAAVSATYCVYVHTTTLHALGASPAATAIASGSGDQISQPALRELVRWVRAARTPEVPIVRSRPFPDDAAAEMIGTAFAYHYINRMVNIFPAPSPIPGAVPGKVKDAAKRILASVLRSLNPLAGTPCRSESGTW
jgi:AhpD family alkylhydroperoxidase